jgi:PAS domain S-box-containing protein
VDHQLRILRFTPTATQIINLITSDIARPISHIVSNIIGYDRLVADTQSVLNTLAPIEVDVQTMGGKWYTLRIQPYRTLDNVIEGAVLTFVDISETKKAQDELREAQAILNAALDNSQVGIAIADAPSGVLRYVNDTALQIRGSDRQSVVEGVGIDQYVPRWQFMDLDGSSLKPEEVPLARAILFGETSSKDFIIRRNDDNERIVLTKAAPITDGSGKVIAGIMAFMDITEHKRTEEALKKALDDIRTLRGILPICSNCKKIRDDQGLWNSVEKYVRDHTEAEFSHGLCPDCMKNLYPEFVKGKKKDPE